MSAKKAILEQTNPDPEQEEYLIYNLYITTLNITVEDGGTVIFQSGKPRDNPNPPGGG